ncbi:hypothetical protein AB0878_05475 [Amycolatopsis sp. NPDC047767]|uniref:hypothetical protein n=1 Tax=Amycolatopsis sp. NPDC047767 TaxID=3156765 RepID=UPI00345671CA
MRRSRTRRTTRRTGVGPAAVHDLEATPGSTTAKSAPGSTAAEAAASGHTIVIDVTTGAKSNLDWNAGFTEHSQEVLPAEKKWTQTVSLESLAWTAVTVRPVDFDLGDKDNTCKITVDGKIVAENSNSIGAICTYQP